jgi:hypothetical protein
MKLLAFEMPHATGNARQAALLLAKSVKDPTSTAELTMQILSNNLNGIRAGRLEQPGAISFSRTKAFVA